MTSKERVLQRERDRGRMAAQAVQESSPTLVKIKINTASFKQIIRHPYLNYEQTKSIVRYRDKYGPLRNFQQLSLDSNFQEKDFQRLAPYIDFSTR